MNERLALLLTTPLMVATLVALFGVLRALFAELVEGTAAAAQRMPGRAFLLGLVNALFVSILVAAMSAIDEGGLLQLLALVLLAVLVIALAFGLSSMAAIIGERMLPDASSTRQVVWGAVAMTLACLTPLIGWFALFPYLALRGLGALVIQLFSR